MLNRLKLSFDEARLLLGFIIATVVYIILGKEIITYPLFLYFNILLTTQSTRRQTIGVAWHRVFGTLLGSVLGLVFYLAFPLSQVVIILYVAVATFCSYFFFSTYVGIVGVIGIMLLSDASNGLPLNYVIWRLIGALLGVGITLLVAIIISPQKHNSLQIFKTAEQKTFDVFENGLTLVFSREINGKVIEQLLVGAIQELRETRYELIDADNDITKEDEQEMLSTISCFADLYMHMRIIARTDGELEEQVVEQLKTFGIHPKRGRVRMFENSLLLNIHTKKLLILWTERVKLHEKGVLK